MLAQTLTEKMRGKPRRFLRGGFGANVISRMVCFTCNLLMDTGSAIILLKRSQSNISCGQSDAKASETPSAHYPPRARTGPHQVWGILCCTLLSAKMQRI